VIAGVGHRVKRAGREVHLGPTEFRLLDYLMRHPGRVLSREQLLDAVWGSEVYVGPRPVDVHIGRLRKALNLPETEDPIRTVRAAGYALDVARQEVLRCDRHPGQGGKRRRSGTQSHRTAEPPGSRLYAALRPG